MLVQARHTHTHTHTHTQTHTHTPPHTERMHRLRRSSSRSWTLCATNKAPLAAWTWTAPWTARAGPSGSVRTAAARSTCAAHEGPATHWPCPCAAGRRPRQEK